MVETPAAASPGALTPGEALKIHHRRPGAFGRSRWLGVLMKTYQSYMVASLLAIGALSPDPAPPPAGECSHCGAALDGVDRMSGQTQCRGCRLPAARYHIDSHWPVTITSNITPIISPSYRPIDLNCPTCGANPGKPCDRRKMGKRWPFHRARVNAAGGAR